MATKLFLISGAETALAQVRTASLPVDLMALPTFAPGSSLFFEY